MHRISKLSIQNYKSCKELSIDLSAFTPLVGYNNAGKSNILSAFKWVLKKEGLPKSSFNNPSEPVSVEATISGITDELLDSLEEKHQGKMEPFIVNNDLIIKREQLEPDAKSVGVVLYVWNQNDEEWNKNPAGIDNAIKALFPEPISISAMENATEDVSKYSKTSTIGRLLSEIIRPIQEKGIEAFSDAIKTVEDIFSADGDKRPEELVQADEDLNKEIEQFFPGLKATIHIPVPTIDNLIKTGTIKISENETDIRDVKELGHGAQRSIQMALIKALSQRGSNASAITTTLLLIDEPELYLHPQAIEQVRIALRKLSAEGFQIIFSTHSPQMIRAEDASNVMIVKKSNQEGTYTNNSLKSAVESVIADAAHQSEVLFSLTNSSKFLFSEHVLIAEGKTEKKVLPHVYNKIMSKTLDEDKIAFIDIGGSGNIPKTAAVLKAMGIPTKALADLDYAFYGAINDEVLSEDDEDILACKTELSSLENKGLVYLNGNGLPEGRGNLTAAQQFEILAAQAVIEDNLVSLHEKLMDSDVWLWTKGTIETHLGLAGKSSSIQYNFVQELIANDYIDVINDDQGVMNFCEWIIS